MTLSALLSPRSPRPQRLILSSRCGEGLAFRLSLPSLFSGERGDLGDVEDVVGDGDAEEHASSPTTRHSRVFDQA